MQTNTFNYYNAIDELQTSSNLIEKNLKLVVKLAHENHFNKSVDIDDIIQAGNYGLVEATNKYFNPNKNYKFITYARMYILKYIKNIQYQHQSIISANTSFYNLNNIISKFIKQYKNKYNKNPEIHEIAQSLGKSEKRIKNTIKYKVNQHYSLDNYLQTDLNSSNNKKTFNESNILSTNKCPYKTTEYKELINIINNIKLSNIEKYIYENYIINKNSKNKICNEQNISTECFSKHLKNIRKKFKNHLKDYIK